MSLVLHGTAVSEGLAEGVARPLLWEIPEVPGGTIAAEEIQRELEHFDTAREGLRDRLLALRARTAARLGDMEARIFDPQLLMLEDSLLVEGTRAFILEHRFSAARAFSLRALELLAMWNRTKHPMVLDRLNDLEDLQVHLLHLLLGTDGPHGPEGDTEPVILIAGDLTPSLTMKLDLDTVVGIVTERGTRTSHWAILARSLGVPAIAGVRGILVAAADGETVLIDGRSGKVAVGPGPEERQAFGERRGRLRTWDAESLGAKGTETHTEDGAHITVRANLDLPGEAESAKGRGPEGVGLFRTEFLVVGRTSMPNEEEQYEAYRGVVSAFAGAPVYIRTFDLGGDKFPAFLKMPHEENPFLGLRSLRLLMEHPEIFRPQLRAILRAAAHGQVRLMLPLVNRVSDIEFVRNSLAEESEALQREGFEVGACPVGALIETPAAVWQADEMMRHSDFLSVGTNDLIQYTLAVDRTNASLQHLYDPFHPAVVRQLHRVAQAGQHGNDDVCVCGEFAGNPVGAFLLLGLGFNALSVAWAAVPEIRSVVASFSLAEARAAAERALAAENSRSVVEALVQSIGTKIDLSMFA